jgi:hypothetical protein
MSKGSYKALAIVCGILGISGISESMRIWNSSAPDIAPERTYLSIMAFLMTFGLFWLARHFWRKSN